MTACPDRFQTRYWATGVDIARRRRLEWDRAFGPLPRRIDEFRLSSFGSIYVPCAKRCLPLEELFHKVWSRCPSPEIFCEVRNFWEGEVERMAEHA